MERKYYEAYEDRYQQIHAIGLQWAASVPSPIVAQTLSNYHISKEQKLLELGCGEGRDAIALLKQGYDLLATDISQEAIAYCRKQLPEEACHFQILNCIGGSLDKKFDFIYAVAVVHMLVEDADRDGFYRFIREHLTPGGYGLICTMGDGTIERSSNPATAFHLQDRVHMPTGTPVKIAGTSCRMVSFDTLHRELARNGLRAVEEGITNMEPDFPEIMYAVITTSALGG
jgi:cyclopropane fatty-acyl-phospholipid synthase-like methyltransferase